MRVTVVNLFGLCPLLLGGFYLAIGTPTAVMACGSDPNNCIVTAPEKNFGMSFQFVTSLDVFTTDDWVLYEPSEEAPEDNDGDAQLQSCSTPGSGEGNGSIGTFDKEQNSAGLTISDMLENMHDAVNSYGSQVSAVLPGYGTVTLNDLMNPGNLFINVRTDTLSSGSGRIKQEHGQFITISLDFAEIEAQAVNAGGSGTVLRETYVTFLHELGHVYTGVGVAINEQALDTFSMELLEECPIE